MNESSNPSLITDFDAPVTQGAFPVWRKVLTKPGEKTFLEIIDHPDARAKSAYIWVFLAGTRTGLISGLVQFLAALIGLLILAPVMLVVAALVKLSSRGPAMYHQERVGRNGQVFTIHKFRSMRQDAEEATGAVWATAQDDRVFARSGA